MPPPLDLPPEVLALVKRSNLLSTRDTKALVRKGLLSEDSAASLGVSIRKPKPKPPVHAVHPELLMQHFKNQKGGRTAGRQGEGGPPVPPGEVENPSSSRLTPHAGENDDGGRPGRE